MLRSCRGFSQDVAPLTGRLINEFAFYLLGNEPSFQPLVQTVPSLPLRLSFEHQERSKLRSHYRHVLP
jgi:hypothetical protein